LGYPIPHPDVQVDPLNPNQAHNSKTGQNYVKQPDGSWIDAKTGQSVDTAPAGGTSTTSTANPGNPLGYPIPHPDVQVDLLNPNQAHDSKTGQNYVRVPCPPPTTQGASN
jgi:hypothetical protein